MPDYDPRTDPKLDPTLAPDANRRAYDDAVFEPAAPSRGLYLVVGVIAAIVAAAGLMFFSGPTSDRSDLARNPDPATIATPDQGTRTPTIPARPAETTPAPNRPQE
jgi:hypothetical protein